MDMLALANLAYNQRLTDAYRRGERIVTLSDYALALGERGSVQWTIGQTMSGLGAIALGY